MKFSIVTHGLEKNPRLLGRFTTAIAELENGIVAGKIPNPIFQTAKSNINTSLETAWNVLIRDPFLHNGRWEQLPRDVYEFEMKMNYPSAHNISGMLKKINSTKLSHPMIDAMRSFLTEISPIENLVKAAAAVVVKRKPADPDALSKKYLAPMASTSAIGMVQGVLTKITEDSYATLKASLITYLKDLLFSYLKEVAENKPKNKYINPIVYRFVDHNNKLYPNVNSLIEKEATKQADHIRECFIIKNLSKLDSILDAKGDFLKIQIIGSWIDIGSMTGEMKLFFKDGATFSIRNSVVWSTSIHGKPFQRFPLNFFNVRMGNGKAITQPSEKIMNTTFVGKTE